MGIVISVWLSKCLTGTTAISVFTFIYEKFKMLNTFSVTFVPGACELHDVIVALLQVVHTAVLSIILQLDRVFNFL